MAAATARPGTHQSSRSQAQSRGKDNTVLTDDDFLFVPPSTAGGNTARSPRGSKRFPVPVTHRTVVGAGTCGIGARKASPRNVHKEWMAEKKAAASTGGAGDDELPPLTFKESRDAEKRRKKAAIEAREEHIDNLAHQCREEKKARRAEAKAVKAESEQFTTEYVKAMLEQRDRDKRRAREWNAEMSLIGTMSPERQRSHRRRTVSEHSQGTGEDEEDLSPQKHKQKLMRQLRDEMRVEQRAWQEMTESQRRVTREVVTEKHDRVQELHSSARESVVSARQQRREAAAKQRESQSSYREFWSTEADGWRSGRGQAVLEARAERKKRVEKYKDHKAYANEEEAMRRQAEREEQKKVLEERAKALIDRNRSTADAVRSSLNTAQARRELESRNHRLRDETQLESKRLRELREADTAAEREQRKELHEDIVRSRSTSPRNRQAPQSPPHFTPRPPPPREG